MVVGVISGTGLVLVGAASAGGSTVGSTGMAGCWEGEVLEKGGKLAVRSGKLVASGITVSRAT